MPGPEDQTPAADQADGKQEVKDAPDGAQQDKKADA